MRNEIFKYGGISRASEDPGKNNTVLGICRQDLITVVAIKLRYLDRCHSKRRPDIKWTIRLDYLGL